MDMSVDSLHGGAIRRIRQACANCRRKKTKCTGERPICFHCRRNRLACVYEPYSATASDGVRPAPLTSLANNLNNVELLQRISTIESRLAELSGQNNRNESNNDAVSHFSFGEQPSSSLHDTTASQPFPSMRNSPIDNSIFPPPPVLLSVIDTYFEHVHNQPYSYFQEISFRQKLESNALPRCLILAVLSSAVRFSVHEYYAGKTREASEKYARESWLSVLADHLTVEDSLNVHVVQTVNLLAVVDYTAGRVSSGWLKIGLATRISQDLHLMTEPEAWLPYPEQEERRRAFWSAYLIDKLISCGKARPLVILDQDCNVQLPCDEETFNRGEWKKTNTLDQLLNWNTEIVDNPSGFGLVILMASIFGRCTRYVHHNRKADEIPPWDTKSEFAGINSSLLLLESYSKLSTQKISDIVQQSHHTNTDIDRQQIGHLIFAHTLYHLCHCLLNHPFLMRLRLKPFGSKAPPSFSVRALQAGCEHAKQLMDLIRDATESGCRIESSFYAYCIAVAGGIHSLASHLEHQSTARRQSDIMHYFNESVESLERLAKLWVHASNMALRLREFHTMSHRFASLLDPKCLTEDLDPSCEEVCWSMIDYGILGADPRKKPLISKIGFSNLPSPSQWALGTEGLGGETPRFDGTSTDIFSGLTPNMRLNDVEYLLNCSPGTNDIA